MTKYYLSSKRLTVQVNTDDRGIIRWTAPVAWTFVGQPLSNLMRWTHADVVEELKVGDANCDPVGELINKI